MMLAPCVPFLLAFPEMVYVMGDDAFHEGSIVVAYGLGMIAYPVATLLIFLGSTDNFDGLTGRVSHRPHRAVGKPPEIVAAEVVEEG